MAWDTVWEDIFSNQEWGRYPAETLIRFVGRNYYKYEDRKKINFLEVGCGPGANLWYLAREGFTVYGVDGSSTAMEIARNRLDKECPGWQGELIVGDIKSLDFESGYFDAVIDNEAIYSNSFDNSKEIIKEVYRVCKPQGRFYSRTFAKGCSGDETGEKVGHNAWLVGQGPMVGKGYTRFTSEGEINELYHPFRLESVESLTWTLDNQKQQVREWIVSCVKS